MCLTVITLPYFETEFLIGCRAPRLPRSANSSDHPMPESPALGFTVLDTDAPGIFSFSFFSKESRKLCQSTVTVQIGKKHSHG